MALFFDQINGTLSALVFCEELTLGTVSAEPCYQIPLNSENIALSINSFVTGLILSSRRVPGVVDGNMRTGGSITADLLATSNMGTLIKHAFGSALTEATFASTPATGGLVLGTAVASSRFIHYITGAGQINTQSRDGSGAILGLSLEKQFLADDGNAIGVILRGCRVSSFGINVPQEGIATVTFGVEAATENAATSSHSFTPVVQGTAGAAGASMSPISNYQVQISLGTAGTAPTFNLQTLVLGGTLIDYWTTYSFELSNNVFGDNFTATQRGRANVMMGRRLMNGSIGMLFKDEADYNRFINAASNPVSMSVALVTGTGNDAAVILVRMPYVKFIGQGATMPSITGEGPIGITLPYTPYEPTEATDVDDPEGQVSVTLVNHDTYV